MTRCGYCGGEIEHVRDVEIESDRCPCGRRVITRIPGGVLVHREGCDGPPCSCDRLLRPGDSATVVAREELP